MPSTGGQKLHTPNERRESSKQGGTEQTYMLKSALLKPTIMVNSSARLVLNSVFSSGSAMISVFMGDKLSKLATYQRYPWKVLVVRWFPKEDDDRRCHLKSFSLASVDFGGQAKISQGRRHYINRYSKTVNFLP